jgi:hypothetical protein
MLTIHSTYRITAARIIAALAVIAGITGCHSAMFQTAKIRDGMEASGGITRVYGADTEDVSDYSIYIRGELGHAASESGFGYSFALGFVSPFKNRYRYNHPSSELGFESGTLPNASAGVFPEFKLQLPRRLPLDFALDLRLNGILPDRVAVITSADLAGWLTPYASYALTGTEGQLLCAGAELVLTDRVSLLLERTQWLSEHDYPDDYDGPARKYPYSIGLALSYRFPRKSNARNYDPRELAHQKPGKNTLGSGRDL